MKLWTRVCLIGLALLLTQPARAGGPALKVLSFNAWLLDIPIYPFGLRKDISEDMDARLKVMPDYLQKTGADIIVLQEVWSSSSKRTLIDAMKKRGYGYAAYTEAKRWMFIFQTAMGDGLLVLSKFPISEKVAHQDFSGATQYSEGFTSKDVMKVTVKHPDYGPIEVYAAHLGAVDFENGNYVKEQVKIHDAQLKELEVFMRTTRTEQISILAADLNMHYQKWLAGRGFAPEFSEAYQGLKNTSCGSGQSLVDTYLYTHKKRAGDLPDFSFDQANPYVGHGFFNSLPSEVEDYVFICENALLKPQYASLEFKHDKLSDHYGVSTSFNGLELNAGETSPSVLTKNESQALHHFE